MIYQPVQQPAGACILKGCQFALANQALELAGQMIKDRDRRMVMSQALWCDVGGHAFSERDPGRKTLKVSTLDPDTEQEVEESRTACGQCAAEAGLNAPRRTNDRQIAAGYAEAAPPRSGPVTVEHGLSYGG